MISICILRNFGESISKHLDIIFKSYIGEGHFPSGWKKANVIPAHKKGNNQVSKNYRPIQYFQYVEKYLKVLLYNSLLEFFIKNNIILSNQSAFKQGDLCIYQVLSITHEIYQLFDKSFEVRGIFFDISKAFDKVWYKGLILKLKQNGGDR